MWEPPTHLKYKYMKKKKQDDTALHKQKLKISCRLEHLFRYPHTSHKKLLLKNNCYLPTFLPPLGPASTRFIFCVCEPPNSVSTSHLNAKKVCLNNRWKILVENRLSKLGALEKPSATLKKALAQHCQNCKACD